MFFFKSILTYPVNDKSDFEDNVTEHNLLSFRKIKFDDDIVRRSSIEGVNVSRAVSIYPADNLLFDYDLGLRVHRHVLTARGHSKQGADKHLLAVQGITYHDKDYGCQPTHDGPS